MKPNVKQDGSGERVRQRSSPLLLSDLALAAVETVPDVAITFWDEELRLIHANSLHLHWSGTCLADAVGRHVEELYPEWALRLAPLLTTCFGTSASVKETLHVAVARPSDGLRQHWLTDVLYLELPDGKNAALVRSRDVTSAQELERVSSRHRDELFQVLEHIPAACAVVRGPPGAMTYELSNVTNTSWCRKGDLVGRRLDEVFPEFEDQGFMELIKNVFVTGQRIELRSVKVTYQTNDGTIEERFLDSSVEPVRNVHGEVDRVLSFSVDVTAEMRFREELERIAKEASSHDKWIQEVLNHNPTPTLLIEPDTAKILFANLAAQKFAGGELPAGQSGCTYPDGRPVPPEEMPSARAARGEEMSAFEIGWRTPSGKKTISCSSYLLAPMHGHPATALMSFYDVTELRDAQKQATEAVRLRDEYMSMASHELRTPLTSVLLQAEVLRQYEDEKIVAAADRIMKHGKRLNLMVTTLLDVSRLSNGDVPLDVEEVDLAVLVEDVAARLKLEAQQAGCTVTVDASSAIGDWDRSRVEQVITNLLTNALKYGNGKPVLVSAHQRGDRAVLGVQDFGIGIAPDKQSRIFDQFQRVGPKGHAPGLGLGLWIVHRIVSALGGTIRVESELGHGSTFVVEFPAKVAGAQG